MLHWGSGSKAWALREAFPRKRRAKDSARLLLSGPAVARVTAKVVSNTHGYSDTKAMSSTSKGARRSMKANNKSLNADALKRAG
jgi:hypothetical protein